MAYALPGSSQANTANFNHAFKRGVMYELVLLAIVCAISVTLPRRFRAEAYQEV